MIKELTDFLKDVKSCSWMGIFKMTVVIFLSIIALKFQQETIILTGANPNLDAHITEKDKIEMECLLGEMCKELDLDGAYVRVLTPTDVDIRTHAVLVASNIRKGISLGIPEEVSLSALGGAYVAIQSDDFIFSAPPESVVLRDVVDRTMKANGLSHYVMTPIYEQKSNRIRAVLIAVKQTGVMTQKQMEIMRDRFSTKLISNVNNGT